jgi:hypothetical protein
MTGDYQYLFDIISETRFGTNETIKANPRSAMILELEP